MPDLLQRLTEERQQLEVDMESLATADDFDPEGEEWQKRSAALDMNTKRIEAQKKYLDQRAQTAAFANLLTRAPAGHAGLSDDVGDQVLRSPAWAAYKTNGFGGRAHLMSVDMNRRALVTSGFLPGVAEQVVGTPPTAATPLLNLLRNVQVDSLTVPIVSLPDSVSQAGVVPEGSQKPEATITVTEWTVTLETIAHWQEVSRQALLDNSLVRDIISGSLVRGVMAKAESQAVGVITGGTYNTVAGGDMLESIRLGIAEVQASGYNPTGVLINPADAAKLDMAIWSVAASFPTQNNSLFGLRVVAAPAVAAGSAYVGDWNTGTAWFYRNSVELFVTDSDVGIVATAPVSNFKRNVLTFLSEIMAKAAVIQGECIVKCTPTGGAALAAGSGGTRVAAKDDSGRRG